MITNRYARRIERLEAGRGAPLKPVHSVIGDSAEDCKAQRLGMIKAGQADEMDEFVSFIIVTPSDTLARIA